MEKTIDDMILDEASSQNWRIYIPKKENGSSYVKSFRFKKVYSPELMSEIERRIKIMIERKFSVKEIHNHFLIEFREGVGVALIENIILKIQKNELQL